MKLSHIAEQPHFIKALVYGYFGAGKTFFAGTASDHEEMQPVLLARAEDGALTIRGKDAMVTPRIDTMAKFDEVFNNLANKRKGWEFNTVILDSGTALLQTCLEEVVERNASGDPSKSTDRISIRDFGDANFMMRKRIRQLFMLPMHVIVTALVREEYNTSDPETRLKRGPVMCSPDFTPKLRDQVMAFADFVWHIHAKSDGTRVLITQPVKRGTTLWLAKSRGEEFSRHLPVEVENPRLPQLLEMMKAAYAAESKQEESK